MRETGIRGYPGSSAGAFAAQPHDDLDDWLGEVSDEDWSEGAAVRAHRDRATPAPRARASAADDAWAEPTRDRPHPGGSVNVADEHRAVIERRRLVAGLVLVVLLGFAVVIPLVLLRGGGDAAVAPVVEPTVTTSTSQDDNVSTTPAATPDTSSSTTSPTTTAPTTTTPTTTPSTPQASGFTLPEGTKLRRGEGDPAVVKALQEALTSAGYDPGPADGTFGRKTEAAVVAFQQDNGLAADGVVGAETAAALSTSESGTGASGFTLPEGTKLRRGEGDPAVVKALQEALASAGYEPGPADGTFGRKTEAAVVAFQQDNDLSTDGVVGAETASALSSALATG